MNKNKWKMLSVAVLLFFVCYFGTSFLGKNRATLLPLSPIDANIPFVKWTIWFYISQYFLLPTSFFLVKKPQNYIPMFYSMLMATLISCSIFLIFPTAIARPETLEPDIVDSARWLLYQLDAPTNCFPSLHVAFACLSAFFVAREHKLVGILFWISSVLIIISTLTLKQHYMIDVLGGIVVATFAYRWGQKKLTPILET